MKTRWPEFTQMLRGLAKRPAYAGMVTLTLGLGIGATATTYSVVDALLMRPLPYRDADALVVIGTTMPGREWIGDRDGLERLEEIALPNFRDLHARTPGLGSSVAIERRKWLAVGQESGAELLELAMVGDGFFELLSVKPLLGRLLRPGDQATEGGELPAVISYEGWQRRFGGDPNVVGKTLSVGQRFTIVGVLPKDFLQPVALVGTDVELWLYLDPTDRRYGDRLRRNVQILGRLQPGTSLEGVRRELSSAQREVAREQVASNVMPNGVVLGAGANALRDATLGGAGRPVLLFLGAALLLLALAGTNAANLLLVRGLEREGELSLRRALGASRRRLAINVVGESVSLALAGGLVGLGIAALGVGGLHRFGPRSLPRVAEVAVNLRIVLAGAGLSLIVGVVIGLVPALRSSGPDRLTNLRSSIRAVSRDGTRLRSALAATQLALALVLAIGAGLLFRSFVELRTEPLGFTANGLVACSVAFKTERPWETWDQALEAIRAVPGVTGAAGASSLPFQTPAWEPRVQPAEQVEELPNAPIPGYAVSAGFFATAGIPIIQGRAFDGSDQPDSRGVAIVNQTFARTTFAARPAIGARLRIFDGSGPGREVEVVGVVGDVVQARVEDGIKPALYVPHTQLPAFINVFLATGRDPKSLETDIRRRLADAGLGAAPVIGLESMQSRIDRSRAGRRFQALLIGAFAGVAVLLSAIGLYGMLAFAVRLRTKELGIRMAIGAGQGQVYGLVLKQGLSVLAIGLTAGLLGAVGLTRLLQGFLYRVSPIDPIAFLTTTALVAAAVLLAALRPAQRAAQIDPMSSIRTEG